MQTNSVSKVQKVAKISQHFFLLCIISNWNILLCVYLGHASYEMSFNKGKETATLVLKMLNE